MPPKTYMFTLRTQEHFNTNNMRKINEKDFVDFTISGPGWSMTVFTFKNALGHWKDITRSGCTLFGNKPDGTRAIIDSK